MGHVKLTVQEITSQMWSSRNFLANVKAEEAQVQQKLEEDFVKWIPNNIKSSIINEM